MRDDSETGESSVGLNGETDPDIRIVRAVLVNRRLFPHIVNHLSSNRERPITIAAPKDFKPSLETKRMIRDEL